MAKTTTVLVTGANKGLGKETARQLGRLGMAVVLGSRDRARGEEASAELRDEGIDSRAVELDVTDPATVEAAAAGLDRLDVLVNNAGVTAGVAALEATADDVRATFEVNVFGVVTAIHAFLPLLRRSTSPRIVNVTSTTASMGMTARGHDFGGAAGERVDYSTSKTALNMLTVQYAHAFAADPDLQHVKINAGTPGFVATDLNANTGTGTVQDGARVLVRLATLPADGPTGGFFNADGPVKW